MSRVLHEGRLVDVTELEERLEVLEDERNRAQADLAAEKLGHAEALERIAALESALGAAMQYVDPKDRAWIETLATLAWDSEEKP